mmetsp:Transcript_22682/g.52605  ORF Transcript_22682/g.52605 Transcript_22682/m.52605 type:complete len:316 (-) Transcript_22682:759-1706(-)
MLGPRARVAGAARGGRAAHPRSSPRWHGPRAREQGARRHFAQRAPCSAPSACWRGGSGYCVGLAGFAWGEPCAHRRRAARGGDLVRACHPRQRGGCRRFARVRGRGRTARLTRRSVLESQRRRRRISLAHRPRARRQPAVAGHAHRSPHAAARRGARGLCGPRPRGRQGGAHSVLASPPARTRASLRGLARVRASARRRGLAHGGRELGRGRRTADGVGKTAAEHARALGGGARAPLAHPARAAAGPGGGRALKRAARRPPPLQHWPAAAAAKRAPPGRLRRAAWPRRCRPRAQPRRAPRIGARRRACGAACAAG